MRTGNHSADLPIESEPGEGCEAAGAFGSRRCLPAVGWSQRDAMTTDALKRIPFLYHFTDRRNLEFIRKLGGLYPLAELRRRGIEIPAPGGNEWSWDANGIKGFDEYVHLCFRATHPIRIT